MRSADAASAAGAPAAVRSEGLAGSGRVTWQHGIAPSEGHSEDSTAPQHP